MTPEPVVSVIIVSWNAGGLLRRCLQTLRTATARHTREVIVVDNHSTEDVVGMIGREFPEVQLHANTKNLGFAGGNNQGMRAARGRYLLLLNPDTELRAPDAIDDLVDHLEANAQVAAAGPRLDFSDGRHQVGDGGYAPSVSAIIAHALFLTQLGPGRWRGLYLSTPQATQSDLPREVDWVCGAATMLRRDVVERAGGLDETIFMYAEDIEWGCRMRSMGLTLHYLPAVHVVHVGGSSEKLAAGGAISTRWLASLARLYLRNGGQHWWLFKISLTAGFLVRSALYGVMALLQRTPHAATRARAQLAYGSAAARLDRRALSR